MAPSVYFTMDNIPLRKLFSCINKLPDIWRIWCENIKTEGMALKEEPIDIIDEGETDVQGTVKSEPPGGYLPSYPNRVHISSTTSQKARYLEEQMLDDPIAGKSLVLI